LDVNDKMKTLELSASDIVANEFFRSSSWHFGQARSWLDLAKREDFIGPIHYAALDFRYGIEYLLFELLVLSCGSLSEVQYQKCLGNPQAMKKMLKSEKIAYEKLSEFTGIISQLDKSVPATTYWNLGELFRLWGIASERLHFCGNHNVTYQEQNWKTTAIARLDAAIESVWYKVTSTGGIGIMRPSEMTSAVRDIWNDYYTGKIDREQAATRLELVRPVSAQQKRDAENDALSDAR
jgi:hypothetical protein